MKNINKPDFIVELEKFTDSIIDNGQETLMLASIEDKIQEYSVDGEDCLNPGNGRGRVSYSADEAISELSQSRMMTEMLMLRSWKTHRPDKYRYIFTSTLYLMRWNLYKEDYESVLAHAEHVYKFFEDALEISPDDFNTIVLICSVLKCELHARLEMDMPVEEITDKINEHIRFLIVAADKKKYKLNAALVIGETADILLSKQMAEEACLYYSKVIDIISRIDDLDIAEKRELAMFSGRYSVALLSCGEKDYGLIEKQLNAEESLLQDIYDAFGDIRSMMDLAIAYSHKGHYFEERNDFKNLVECHLKKIRIIQETFLNDEDDSQYTVEFRLESLFYSMRPIINCGLIFKPSERARLYKQVHEILDGISDNVSDIRLVSYSNALSMEIFKVLDGIDDAEAERYLFDKIKSLNSLVDEYGLEEGIKEDILVTMNESKSFVTRMGSGLETQNRYQWMQMIRHTLFNR